MRLKRKIGALVAVGVLALIGVTVPAKAVTSAAMPGSAQAGFATPVVVISEGGSFDFVNADSLEPHNLQADKVYGPITNDWCTTWQTQMDTCPAFWSEIIGVGVAPVLGVAAMKPGQYPFLCIVHARTMKGTLIVVG